MTVSRTASSQADLTRLTPHTRRGRDIWRALIAIAVLVTALVGLPLLLIETGGSPLPSGVLSLSQVGDRLLRPDSGRLLLNLLLWVAWFGWACFALTVVAEVVAQLRNRATPRLAGLGSAQRLAGRLVAAAILVLPSHPVTFAVTPASVTLAAPAQTPPAASPPVADAAPAAAPARHFPSKTYVVRPPRDGLRDSLWSIAERHLGDPLRWREIADLNRGRTQPDGRRLEDPHWIYPGWRLLMPLDATGLPAAGQPPSPSPTAGRSQRVGAPHVGRPTPDQLSGRESAPTAPAAAPPVANREPEPNRRPPSSLGEDRARHAAATPDDGVPLGALAGGGALLVAGFLAALARLRIRQRRRRPSGARMSRPNPELAEHEVRLRVLAEPDDREFLDFALRSLSHLRSQTGPDRPGSHPPEIHAALLRPDSLDLILANPDTDPPSPYTASGAGHVWSVTKSAELPVNRSNAGDSLAPYPALVPIGHIEDALVLIDVEGVGSVAISGDQVAAREVLHWVAAELALGNWSDYLHATCVGLPRELRRLDSERLSIAERLDGGLLAQLGHHTFRNVLSSRASGAGEAIMPELLLLATAPDEEYSAQLLAITGGDQRTGVGVVVAGDWAQAAWNLHVTGDGGMTVPGIGATVIANRLDEAVQDVLVGLLSSADLPAEATVPSDQPAPTSSDGDAPLPTQPRIASGLAVQTAEVNDHRALDQLDDRVAAWFDDSRADISRVRIMGPVQVTAPGTIDPNRMTVCTELVTYMATHGKRVDDPAKLDMALWPERAVSVKTRTQAVVRARAWLGTAADGEPRLSKGYRGEFHLGPSVLLDWDLFRALAERGMAAGPDGAEDLATALRLIRGKPFERIPEHRYAWVAETFLEQDIPVAVIDVAHRLAGLLRDAGDVKGARDAARTAQTVDRYDERPWRDLLEAEHALGNTRTVQSLISDLQTTLEVDVEDELDPETNEVIARVLPSRRNAS